MILEWQSDCEMECEVAAKVWMYERVVVSACICRVDSLHASVETQHEEVECHTKSNAITCGYLLVEFSKLEHTSRLVGVVADGPDVSGVNKQRAGKFPEEESAVFE